MSRYFVRTVIVKITDVRTEPDDSLLNASAGGGEEGVPVRSCVCFFWLRNLGRFLGKFLLGSFSENFEG